MSIVVEDGAKQERDKYAEIWSTIPEYKNWSPGLDAVDRFMSLQLVKNRFPSIGGATLIDIGCGEGVAGLEFVKRGFRVSYVDITDAGLRPEVDRFYFYETPLWNFRPDADRWDFGFCCDVMEHIPPEYTMAVIQRILDACHVTYLQICNVPDSFGAKIGEPLHLTVQPFKWWLIRLATLGTVLDARDLCGNSMFLVSR